MRRIQVIVFVLSVSFFAAAARAQVATGTPPFGSFSGGPFDTINNGNLNVHFSIPVVNKAGRGLPFNYNLTYDTSVWYPVASGSTTSWQPVNNWGWSTWTEVQTGYMHYNQQTNYCNYWNGHYYQQVPYEVIVSDFIYYDAWGAAHPFPGQDNIWSNPGGGCPSGTSTYDNGAVATDGSGYIWYGQNSILTAANGVTVTLPVQGGNGAGSVSDANGNTISLTGSGVFTDTLSVTALTVSGNGTPSSPMTFTYPAAQSQHGTVTVNYTAYTVQTAFGCGSIAEFGPTGENLVSEIDLPDDNPNGTRDRYLFDYEVTPNDSHNPHYRTGRLASVILPTGGTISYVYSGGAHGITCNTGSSDGTTATLSRTTPDGTWTYAHSESGTAWTTTLTDPNSNQTTFNFQSVTPTGSTTVQTYETERQLPSTTDSETIYTCYNASGTPSYPCNSTSITLPITRRTVWTTLGSQTSEVDTQYDTSGYGFPQIVNQYDWGPSSTWVRETAIGYNFNISCGVTNSAVIDRPCSVSVYNASNQAVTATSYTYDANGNLLKQTPSVGPQLQFTYNSNGTLATSYDGAGTTNYGYGSNSCNAFPDSVTPPISALKTTATWDCNGALPSSTTDANSKTTNLGYDLMNRLTSASYPDGGSLTIAYTPTQVQTTTKITSSVSRTDTTNLDSQGRISNQTVRGVETALAYDSLGRLSTVSVANSGQQDTYSYDTLSRVTKVTHADNNYVQASYSNNCATGTDESGKVREVCKDGLGRTNQVIEDPSGLDYTTTYSYDPLNGLTGVTQGSQSRSFQYDALGRLTQASTPESGTVYYTYDSDSTCGSLPGDLVKRVDAGGIRTCYAYDSVHRLTSKAYSDSTARANYYYDQTSYNGLTINYGKGRRTGMSDGSGQSAWSYDPMGRALSEEKTIATVTKTMGYSYNYDGSLASVTYPSSRTITYGVDSLGRPKQAVDSANSINYATAATYAPQGSLASVSYGSNINYSIGYNNRLAPSQLQASTISPAATFFQLKPAYNGNLTVSGMTNGLSANRSQSFSYDHLNRITSAQSAATSGQYCWAQSFTYDRYGNLTPMSNTATGNGCWSLYSLSLSVNGNNQFSGFSYDAAGDVTSDGAYSYTWNAEGLLKSAGSTGYTYDGDGGRVEKSSGKYYWFGPGGAVLAETDTSGNTQNEYIYFAGGRTARRDGSGNVYYYFGDHLGTARLLTNASGTLCYDADFTPFGQELAYTTTCSQNYKFTGMERDTETANDHTWYRGYEWNVARWLSPDPLGGGISNPQSLNRYAYVVNNPTNLIDPLGLGYSGQPNSCPSTGGGPQGLNGFYLCQMGLYAAGLSSYPSGIMPGEYGYSGSFTYGEDYFDALAANTATEHAGVDANGNLGFIVNPNPGSPNNLSGVPWGGPSYNTYSASTIISNGWLGTVWDTVGLWDPGHAEYYSTGNGANVMFSAASNSGYSPGYPGNVNFGPTGFDCVTCGLGRVVGSYTKHLSSTPQPPMPAQPAQLPLPGAPLPSSAVVFSPVPSQ